MGRGEAPRDLYLEIDLGIVKGGAAENAVSRMERNVPEPEYIFFIIMSTPNTTRPSIKRKAWRACAGCVNSKTRCEDITYPEGCLRCRTKKWVCSLAVARASDDIEDSLPNSDGLMLCRMRALEDELTNVRELLLQVQTQSSAVTIQGGRT